MSVFCLNGFLILVALENFLEDLTDLFSLFGCFGSGVFCTVMSCFIDEVVIVAAQFALDRSVCYVHLRVSVRRLAAIAYRVEILPFGNIAIPVTEATKRTRL